MAKKMLDDYLSERKVDRAHVDDLKATMLAQTRAYRLRELRASSGLTQGELAKLVGVSQRQISKIENGNIENSKVSTLRRYLKAVGGSLQLSFVTDDQHLLLR